MTDSTYVDGFVCAVNNQNKQAYIDYAKKFGTIFREYGALEVVDCWGDDVPEGKLTSFTMAVKREIFSALDAIVRPGAILATNTSYLDIDEIAASTARVADVIGLHFHQRRFRLQLAP